MTADCIFTGGVLAPEGGQALAIRDGRILALGTSAEMEALAGPATRRVDLGGRCLIPGMNDAHAHLWKIGHLLTSMLDLRGVPSLADLQGALTDFSTGRSGWVQGRGWNEARFPEGRAPNRHDLDAIVGDRPVFLTRTCGHVAVANTRALALAGVDASTPAPSGGAVGREAEGQPDGLLYETAMGLVAAHIPPPTAAEAAEMITAAAHHQLSLGITSATDPGVSPELLQVYRGLDRAGALPYRVNVMAVRAPLGAAEVYPLPERYLSDFLRIDSIKLFADGGLSGGTAALKGSYRDGSRGLLRLTAEEMVELTREAHATGLRIAVHAIGDAAIEAVLQAYERLQPWRPGHRIEHLGLPDPLQLERVARLGLIAATQTIFLRELGDNFLRLLPEEMLGQCYPVASMVKAGIPLALSSDAPVVSDDNPLAGMAAAVTRRAASGAALTPGEGIDVATALQAYTLGSARASGDEHNRGSLTPGKWADLAVLSRNPLETEDLDQIRVDMTIVGGRIAYQR